MPHGLEAPAPPLDALGVPLVHPPVFTAASNNAKSADVTTCQDQVARPGGGFFGF